MSPHPPETRQFNVEIQFLLKPDNPHARSLLAFIQRTLRQFQLEDYITEVDIFIEAYLRGVRLTGEAGTAIQRPKAWMRQTALNIIRECKRDRLRYRLMALDELVEQAIVRQSPEEWESRWGDADITEEIQAVIQALDSLEPMDRQLIWLRIIEGLSWKDVQVQLLAEGELPISNVALRKRGQRALERLRQAYHTCRSPVSQQV